MNPFSSLISKLQELDQYNLKIVSIIFFVGSIIFAIGIHQIFLSKEIKKIDFINTKRKNIGVLLARKAYITAQKNKIFLILSEQPYFWIKDYCIQTLKDLRLISKAPKIQQETVQEKQINDQYTQLTLVGMLQNLSTKEMVNFFLAIEKNPRVSLNEAKISLSQDNTITISYQISALKMEQK